MKTRHLFPVCKYATYSIIQGSEAKHLWYFTNVVLYPWKIKRWIHGILCITIDARAVAGHCEDQSQNVPFVCWKHFGVLEDARQGAMLTLAKGLMEVYKPEITQSKIIIKLKWRF